MANEFLRKGSAAAFIRLSTIVQYLIRNKLAHAETGFAEAFDSRHVLHFGWFLNLPDHVDHVQWSVVDNRQFGSEVNGSIG